MSFAKKYFSALLFILFTVTYNLTSATPDSLKNLLSQAEKNDDYLNQTALLIELADYYFGISNIDSSEFFYQKGLKIADENNLYKEKIICQNWLGAVYYRKGDYAGALNWYFSALEDFENYENDTLKAATYNKMAGVYYKLSEYNKTLDYLNKSLELKLKIGDSIAISQTYNNLGNIYAELGELDTALAYYFKDLKISEEKNNLYNLPISYTNIASVYREKKEYDKALKYAQKALNIDTMLNDLYGIAADYNEIALAYKGLGQTQKAVYYFDKSIKIAKQIQADELVVAFLKDYSSFYEQIGNYSKALELYKQYSAYKDTLLDETKNQQIIEAEKKYQTERKNAEIQTLKLQKEKAQNIQKIFFIATGFLFVIALLVIILFRFKVRANRILNDKNEQLRQMNNTQNRLMSIISHDLKAPLSAFYSITASLKNKFDKLSVDEVKKYFDRMLNSAIALKMQLENMLNWAITQQREIRVNKSKYNLPILITKVVMILQEFANEKQITIENTIQDDEEIETDGRLLNIVLNNLISNAIKYSPPNSKIIISKENINDKIRIKIRDFGVGMTEEEVKQLFTNQTIAHNENSGTGLGLIVSKDIINKLGGTIYAKSEKNKGTEITIELTR